MYRGGSVEEILRRDAEEDMSRGAAKVTVAPEEQGLRELKVQLSVTFVQRWQKYLHGDERGELSDEAAVTNMAVGLKAEGLSTAKDWDRFWKEAQEDIDRLKQPITAPSVVVLNHAIIPYVDTRGESRVSGVTPTDYEYLANIRQLLSTQYPGGDVSKVTFDDPLYYLLDSQKKLADETLDSVILTPYSQGGSLIPGQALREIGSEKRIFLAGTYAFDACLNTTAEELRQNGNEVFVVGDAAVARRKPGRGAVLASSNWEQIRPTFRCESISMITMEDMRILLNRA